MSFDLVVLDKYKRFGRKEDFYDWLEKVTSWDEDLDYVFLWIYRFPISLKNAFLLLWIIIVLWQMLVWEMMAHHVLKNLRVLIGKV